MAVVLLLPVAPLAAVAGYKYEKHRRVTRALKSSAQTFTGGQPHDQKGVRFGTWNAATRQFEVNPEFRNVFGNQEPAGPVDMLTPDEAHALRKQQMQKFSLPPRFRGAGGTVAPTAAAHGYGNLPGTMAGGGGYGGYGTYSHAGSIVGGGSYCAPQGFACGSPISNCGSPTYTTPCTAPTSPAPLTATHSAPLTATSFINTTAAPSPVTSPVVRAGAAYNAADIYSH